MIPFLRSPKSRITSTEVFNQNHTTRNSSNFYYAFILSFWLIAFGSWQNASATHSAGGYLSYKWLGSDIYQVTVTFYRDCSGIVAPDSMEIDFNSVSCGLSLFINAPQVAPSGTEIGYPCPSSTTCDGGTSPGFQKYIYQVTVILPFACTDWILSFQPALETLQTLGRNNIITTLNQPLGSLYTQTTLDNVNYPNNSSVTFINDPVLFICAGQNVVSNLGANDINGDSLSYQLATAMQAAGLPVSYVTLLSGTNPLFPVGSVSINSKTGDLTINTSTLQVGVIDVLVTEYKNGVPVGSVVLDIQVIVQNCTNNYPTVSGINNTSVFTDSVCAGNIVSFNVYSNDIDAGQIVSMSWDNGINPPATFNWSGSPYPTGTFTWSTTLADARSQPYTFTVTVKDNACPSNGFQTHAYSIYVISPTINISPSFPILCNGQSVSLTATGGKSYSWSPSTGLSATTGVTVTANPTTTTVYTITGTDGLGCTGTGTVTVTVNPKPNVMVSPTAPVLCNGQSTSLSAGGASSYIWSPSTGLSGVTGPVVSAGPTTTTTYVVTGTDANGCTNTKSVTVSINPLPAITVNPTAPVLCHGQSVTLNASGGTSYTWSPATGLSATSGAGVNANPSSTSTYTVTGTDANGCSNTKSVTVTINPLPSININPTAPVLCNGQSVSLTASGGSTYIWSPSTGLSATTGSSVNANPSTTTIYTVTGTDANGCSNTKTVTVSINPLPNINVSPAAPIVCNGQSTSLTATGGVGYTWGPSSSLSGVSGPVVSAGPISTTTYTVTGTDANGCSNSKSVTVTVNPLPVITVNPLAPILCNGQSVSLTASGGITYIWSPGTGLSSTTGSPVSANPSSSTTYLVTGTDANGCSNTKSVSVTVNPLPTITVSPVSPILCNGQTVSLTAGGGTTYVWSPFSGLSATTGATVIAGPSSTTIYTVTGTDANGCTNTKSVTVNVNPLPNINASPANSVLCNGQSVSLTAGGGSSYIWSPSTGLSSATGSTVSANPSVTTTYTVTGTDANGCTNTKSVTVTINPLPTITASPNSPGLCNGASVLLTAGGGSTYVWSPSTGLSATTGSTVSADPAATSTYTITGTDANGCSNTTSVTVSVIQTPLITINPVSPILCNGQSVSLTAGGGNTYSWSPSTGLSATTGSTVTANPPSTTTYVVTGTIAGGCTGTASVTVTVNPLPVITASPSAPILCIGQSVTITAGGANSYFWSPTTGLSSGTGAVVSANPTITTVYTVTGSDANGCSNTASVNVTVNPLPIITTSPSAPVLCNGQSVALTAGGGVSYIWSPTAGLSSGSGSAVSADPSGTTAYNVTGTDANGCSNSASVTITINPLPVITASPTAPVICNGQSVSITAGGGVSYTWSPNSGLSSGSGTTVTANPSSTISYVVTGTDGNGCSNTATVMVTVNPLPVIVASPSVPVICNGQSVTLSAGGGTSYIWSPSAGLSATTGPTVSADPTATTSYSITGTDANGCSNTASVTVTVNALPVITATPPAPAICNGQSVLLTAAGGISYSWNPTTGLSSGSGASVTADPSTTSPYIVTGTDNNGCSNTASVTVKVNPLPVIAVSPANPAMCIGSSVVLTASGGISYGWSPTSGLSSGTGTTVTANPVITSIYVVTGTDTNGCSNTSSVTVKVNLLPVVNTGPDVNICVGASVKLNVTSTPGGMTYSWTPTSDLSCNNCPNPTANPPVTTSYVVLVTDSDGCSAKDTVVVIATPLVAQAGPDTIVCSGNPVQLYANGGSGYQWSPVVGLSNPNASDPIATPPVTTTYTVTVTSGSCSATATATVNLFPDVPTPHITNTNDSLYCSSDPSYKSYQWYFNSTMISNATKSFYYATKTGNYNVAVTDTNGCTISVGINIIYNVGIPSISSNKSISVFPNPASSQLFIHGYGDAENMSFVIYNTIGEKIVEKKISQYNQTSIDIENISAGVYFIEILQREDKWVSKFVKE